MEITLTYTLPDFRPDIADFARDNHLTVYYGDYILEEDLEEDVAESDNAMLVSVGYFDWENLENAEELQERFLNLVGEEESDLYTGEEYWANFADAETLESCLAQFGQKIREIFPDTRFARITFEE